MFELESAIKAWRKEIAQGDAIDHDSLRELEGHLRDVIDAEIESGTSEEAAFAVATDQLGQREAIHVEYEKVHSNVPWQRRLFVMLVGFMVVTTIYHLASAASIISEMISSDTSGGQGSPVFYKAGSYLLP